MCACLSGPRYPVRIRRRAQEGTALPAAVIDAQKSNAARRVNRAAKTGRRLTAPATSSFRPSIAPKGALELRRARTDIGGRGRVVKNPAQLDRPDAPPPAAVGNGKSEGKIPAGWTTIPRKSANCHPTEDRDIRQQSTLAEQAMNPPRRPLGRLSPRGPRTAA
jgi:hypothetical protein